MSASGVGNVIRWIFLFFDKLIYLLVEKIAEIFYILSRGTIFTQEDINAFSNRIYMLVALIVLFRLAFSFVNYIINPDQLTDSQKGGSKLLVKVVTSLVLLVLTPTLFNEAYRLQALVIDQNVIGKLVTGESMSQEGMSTFGKTLSYGTFRSFFGISKYISNQYCGEGVEVTSQACINKLDDLDPKKTIGSTLANADQSKSIELLTVNDIVNEETTYNGLNNDKVLMEGTVYIIDYKFGLSTITGGVIAWLVLSFCFDVAIRMIKLGFLQLIAPVPIVMSLAPGQEKNNSLSKWGRECVSTYISLFVRLLVIYLAFYVINLMIGTTSHGVIDVVTGYNTTDWQGTFVNLFAVIGALLFAKQVPKMIEEMFGFKGGMKLTLNPLKAMASTPIIGGALAAGTTLGLNTARNVAGLGVDKIRRDSSAGERFRQRQLGAFNEASGRFRASGVLGTDKYSGETQGKAMQKWNQERRTNIRKAQQGLKEQQRLYNLGQKSRQNMKDPQTVADYQQAGFKNREYINSLINIDNAKKNLENKRTMATEMSNRYQAATNLYAQESRSIDTQIRSAQQLMAEAQKNGSQKDIDYLTEQINSYEQQRADLKTSIMGNLQEQYQASQKDVQNAEKAVSSLENNHKNYIVPQFKDDAELESARGLAKGGIYPGGTYTASSENPVSSSTIEGNGFQLGGNNSQPVGPTTSRESFDPDQYGFGNTGLDPRRPDINQGKGH